MQTNQTSIDKLNTYLKVCIKDDNQDIWLSERKTLMKLIGVLGILLPILLYVFLYFATGHTEVLESISHYFFTRANPIFVIVVSLMAIFLMIYKYEKPIDFYLSFFAGLAAIVVLILPTDPLVGSCKGVCSDHVMAYIRENDPRQWTHYISAAIFLGILNYMCFFLFTKSDKPKELRSQHKHYRNMIYYVCGSLMTAALVIILLGTIELIDSEVYQKYKLTFWMESLAVMAFGVSWLVKGGFILKDKVHSATD